MKIAVITCVYPSAAAFLEQFYNSLQNQTDLDFDLLIANDGLSNLNCNFSFCVKTCYHQECDLI